LQSAQVLEPFAKACFPPGQLAHVALASFSLNVPTAHSEQVSDASSLNLPDGQLEQDGDALTLNVPAAQVLHLGMPW
jgi:hypothetical protein